MINSLKLLTFRHASAFSGIGGFDLAAQWMGWKNVFQIEIDSYCHKVLTKNFPDTERYGDIREFDGNGYKGKVDVFTAGFPCQPFSVAGKRRGKADERYLWEETIRVIREIEPKYVVGENVPGIINLALDKVCADLEMAGYEVQPFVIPACAVNAWHRRDRVWFLAYANRIGWENGQEEPGESVYNKNRDGEVKEQSRRQQQCGISESGIVSTDTNGTGCEKQRLQEPNEPEFPSAQCSSRWEVEPPMGRVVDGIPNRVDRLTGLGNAIVPQVALEIFKIIEQFHQLRERAS